MKTPTPGPWRYVATTDWTAGSGDDHTMYAVFAGDEQLTHGGCGCCSAYGHSIESEADARLIAAAPELLDSLEYLLGQFDQAHQALCVERSPSACAAIAQARAALAKATGAQP